MNITISNEFLEGLIIFSNTESSNYYDVAVASELLAENAKKMHSETEAVEYITQAAKAWREEALGPVEGPSNGFVDFLEATAKSASSAIDRAVAASLLGEYYDQLGGSIEAGHWWARAAKAYAEVVR